MASKFTALSSKKMANIITNSTKRIAVVAPGIQDEVADALIAIADRRGVANIDLVIDFSEDVFRLGYGSINAINKLKEYGFDIRNHSGLRIGLLICDDNAWTFSPVALYIETEKDEDDLPNAVELTQYEASRLLLTVSESARKEIIQTSQDSNLVEDAKKTTVEISVFPVNEKSLKEVNQNLREVPPVAFNVARQVRVFEPYLQYVEIELRGCSIQRHKIQLPKSIIGLANNRDIENRLSTSFNLIDKDSKLSSKQLDDEVKALRDEFTRPLKKSDRVILKNQRTAFDKEVMRINDLIDEHKENVRIQLDAELQGSLMQLVDYYLPIVMDRPPQILLRQIPGDKPSEEEATRWLVFELSKCIPKADSLIKDMNLEFDFKDITWETLEDPSLMEKLKDLFPCVNWDKPYHDYTAAKSDR